MLDQLDNIPWSRLHHAYGTAEDVPALIRALASSGDEQETALYELHGNIWHQGTVYEATSYAVPFLVELAAQPTLTSRGEILGLIGAIADGKSYLAVHGDLVVGQPLRDKPDFEHELQHVRSSRDEVYEHGDVFIQLLNDSEPMVRAGAAHVLSRFYEHASEFGP